ncbi:uncharacterized protein LOC136768140 [Amia ocellicauda]|uniref:uncharacterized protein LOC136768140 n=1 Tax=Amia ocellicauda TaxID=2972642 RepID=UPI00346461A7
MEKSTAAPGEGQREYVLNSDAQAEKKQAQGGGRLQGMLRRAQQKQSRSGYKEMDSEEPPDEVFEPPLEDKNPADTRQGRDGEAEGVEFCVKTPSGNTGSSENLSISQQEGHGEAGVSEFSVKTPNGKVVGRERRLSSRQRGRLGGLLTNHFRSGHKEGNSEAEGPALCVKTPNERTGDSQALLSSTQNGVPDRLFKNPFLSGHEEMDREAGGSDFYLKTPNEKTGSSESLLSSGQNGGQDILLKNPFLSGPKNGGSDGLLKNPFLSGPKERDGEVGISESCVKTPNEKTGCGESLLSATQNGGPDWLLKNLFLSGNKKMDGAVGGLELCVKMPNEKMDSTESLLSSKQNGGQDGLLKNPFLSVPKERHGEAEGSDLFAQMPHEKSIVSECLTPSRQDVNMDWLLKNPFVSEPKRDCEARESDLFEKSPSKKTGSDESLSNSRPKTPQITPRVDYEVKKLSHLGGQVAQYEDIILTGQEKCVEDWPEPSSEFFSDPILTDVKQSRKFSGKFKNHSLKSLKNTKGCGQSWEVDGAACADPDADNCFLPYNQEKVDEFWLQGSPDFVTEPNMSAKKWGAGSMKGSIGRKVQFGLRRPSRKDKTMMMEGENELRRKEDTDLEEVDEVNIEESPKDVKPKKKLRLKVPHFTPHRSSKRNPESPGDLFTDLSTARAVEEEVLAAQADENHFFMTNNDRATRGEEEEEEEGEGEVEGEGAGTV